jgi:GGDEF domain-containing protein
MVWGSAASERLPNAYIGFYLVRLEFYEPPKDEVFPEVGPEIGKHVISLLQKVLRDSDIPATLTNNEHLAILRDIDPQHAYAVAQRFLTSAGSSTMLEAAKVRTCVGYIVYPLSTQPNFPVDRWSTLLELARRMSHRGDSKATACGFGLLSGPQITEASIPESDLVPLAFQNPDTLVKAGILQVQQTQILSNK